MRNLIIITYDWASLDIAVKAKLEGFNVYVGLLSPQEAHKKISKDENEVRESVGRGLVNIYPIEKLLKLSPNDTIVIFDNNYGFEVGEKFRELGFTGIIPTKDDFLLERNREYAYQVVKQIFKDVDIIEFEVFNSVKEAISFLKKANDIYVVKSDGDNVSTFVPHSLNIDEARKECIQVLLFNEAEYNRSKIVLQRKIINGIEFIPDILFDINFEKSISSIDIEDKYFGNGLSGKQVGCAGEVGFLIKEDTEIYQRFVSPLKEFALSKKKNIIDVGIIYDQDRDKFYFTEFCPRLGWGHTYNIISIFGSVSKFLDFLINGNYDDEIFKKTSIGITLFNTFVKGNNQAKILIPRYNENICLYDASFDKKNNILTTCGYGDEAIYFVNSGDKDELYSLIEASEKLLKKDIWKAFYWRYDLFSPFNKGGIMERLDWIIGSGLIDNNLLLTI